MLPDPIPVTPSLIDHLLSKATVIGPVPSLQLLRTTDVSPGRTTRVGTFNGNKSVLQIAVTQSQENKGVTTDRCSLRLTTTKVVADVGSISASAQLILAFPRVGYSLDEMRGLLSGVLSSILMDYQDQQLSLEGLERVLSGEP